MGERKEEKRQEMIVFILFISLSFFQVTFNVLSIYARGLGNPLNSNLLFDLIEKSNCDLCFVQETLVSSDENIKSLSRQWLGRSFWSPATGKQGGVVILISPKCSDEVVSWKKDSNGRIVSILIRIDGVDLNFVNICAPTNLTDLKSFFESLHEFFIPATALLIGGDFNCYENALDKFGGNVSAGNECSSLRSDFVLVDAWRGVSYILTRANLLGLIMIIQLVVDWISFLFQKICLRPTVSAKFHLTRFLITILFPLFLKSLMPLDEAQGCGSLIIHFLVIKIFVMLFAL